MSTSPAIFWNDLDGASRLFARLSPQGAAYVRLHADIRREALLEASSAFDEEAFRGLGIASLAFHVAVGEAAREVDDDPAAVLGNLHEFTARELDRMEAVLWHGDHPGSVDVLRGLRALHRLIRERAGDRQLAPGDAFHEHVAAQARIDAMLSLLVRWTEVEDERALVAAELAEDLIRSARERLTDDFDSVFLARVGRVISPDEGHEFRCLFSDRDVPLRAARHAFSHGRIDTARRILGQLTQWFPDDEDVQQLAGLLAPPEVRSAEPMAEEERQRRDRSRQWLAGHSHEHRGKWVAVHDGELVASGEVLSDIEPDEGFPAGALVTRVL